jgi:hypothetical protein
VVGPNDTDEALQNAWIRITGSLNKYISSQAPLIAFCRWHAKNAAVDLLRRRRSERYEVLAEDLAGRTGEDSDRDPLDWLASTQPSAAELDREFFDEFVTPQDRAEVYVHFLRLAFSIPSPPHELICYGLSKLLEWKPRRIVSELGPDPMKAVEMKLESELKEETELPAAALDGCFDSLRHRIARRLGELIDDNRTRKRYERLLGRIVASTVLKEYFSSDPSGDISAWWWGIHRQLVKEAAKERTPAVERILNKIL